MKSENILVFDVEATWVNHKGKYFNPNNRLVSYAYFIPSNSTTHFKYFTDPDFPGIVGTLDSPDTLVVGFNIKYDLHWVNRIKNVPLRCRVWDCQLAEHLLSGQRTPYGSLNDALTSYGLPTKLDVIKTDFWDKGIDTDEIPIEILEEYNKWDVYVTYLLYQAQRKVMTPEQVNLLLTEGEDMKTLIAAESAGILWDKQGAENVRRDLNVALEKIHTRLFDYLPDSCHGSDITFNFNSGDQLSALLYGGIIHYDYTVPEEAVYQSGPKKGQSYTRNRWFVKTVKFPPRFSPIDGTEVKKTKGKPNVETRFYQVDEPTLLQIKTRRQDDKDLVRLLLERSEKIKVLEMIDTIESSITDNNWQDNYIHGSYTQNVAVTGRLSSKEPNMQNTPAEIDQLLVSRYE